MVNRIASVVVGCYGGAFGALLMGFVKGLLMGAQAGKHGIFRGLNETS